MDAGTLTSRVMAQPSELLHTPAIVSDDTIHVLTGATISFVDICPKALVHVAVVTDDEPLLN